MVLTSIFKDRIPDFQRSPQECQAWIKHLKTMYFQTKRANNKSGGKRRSFPYYERLDALLNTRPSNFLVDNLYEMSLMDIEHVGTFPQCCGAIDGTHIHIIAPKEHHTDYYNRKSLDVIYKCRYINRILHFVSAGLSLSKIFKFSAETGK
jgi:hypothetical protein